jgi:hypothetical protein
MHVAESRCAPEHCPRGLHRRCRRKRPGLSGDGFPDQDKRRDRHPRGRRHRLAVQLRPTAPGARAGTLTGQREVGDLVKSMIGGNCPMANLRLMQVSMTAGVHG